ncbi:MAG: alginate lyase family protein [Deltaproteobacteria bacterium]|nr:alginate lyase family protein [Deltaproteobacteria bacterium]
MVQHVGHMLAEVAQLGLGTAAYRLGWEARARLGLAPALLASEWRRRIAQLRPCAATLTPLPLPDLDQLARRMPSEQTGRARDVLLHRADAILAGKVLCYGHMLLDFGEPIDWHRDPISGQRFALSHWSSLSLRQSSIDVKDLWELGRFSQVYPIARAAMLSPSRRAWLTRGLARQVRSFIAQNPAGYGVHWASGQEIAIRQLAWSFAASVLPQFVDAVGSVRLVRALYEAALHLEGTLPFAERAIPNNHVLAEATALLVSAAILPDAPRADRWRFLARRALDRAVSQQFYPDGGYLQQSHNYQRFALDLLIWATIAQEAGGLLPRPSWLAAMRRSVAFLRAQQCAKTGRLPNYGANDGAWLCPLADTAFGDFRPTLQTAAILAGQRRCYPPGPYDAHALWLLGPQRVDDALPPDARRPSMQSQSFPISGLHVLRGTDGEHFASFRCGSLRDRFAHQDMLHLDLTWRTHNLVADGGSFRYNGAAALHRHFSGPESHNTLLVDGYQQMHHHRRFTMLYPTRARLLDWMCDGPVRYVCGEHFGYCRYVPRVVHRRAVLYFVDDLWLVFDWAYGATARTARVHWLIDAEVTSADRVLALECDAGTLYAAAVDQRGGTLESELARGASDPPRGWISRHYGQRSPAWSWSIALPASGSLLTVFSGGRPPRIVCRGDRRFSVEAADSELSFEWHAAGLRDIRY